MVNREEGKAEKMFKEIGIKIDSLIHDLDKAADQAKEDYSDQIGELKRNAEKLKTEFYDFQDKYKDRWDEVEANLKKAGNDLKSAFKAAFKKK